MFAAADRDETSHQVAHHMVQKRVRPKAKVDEIALLDNIDLMKIFHRRLRLTFRRTERGEIVLADQAGGGFAHRVGIERRVAPAGPAGDHRRTHGVDVQRVEIGALEGAEARMEVVRHRPRPLDRDALRQERVRAAHPGEVGALEFGIEMDDLAERVHAGIRAPRDDRLHARLREFPQRAFENVLDGRHV